MKPDQRSDYEESAEDIRDALSVLRQLRTSPDTESQYRAVVNRELQLLTTYPSRIPWWRRTVQVPLPVAVTVSILLLFSVWTAQTSRQINSSPPAGVGSEPSNSDVYDPPRSIEPDRNTSDQTTELAMSVSATYLCGIGPLHTETLYLVKDSDQ